MSCDYIGCLGISCKSSARIYQKVFIAHCGFAVFGLRSEPHQFIYSGIPNRLSGCQTSQRDTTLAPRRCARTVGGMTPMPNVAPPTPLTMHSLFHNYSFRIVIGPTRFSCDHLLPCSVAQQIHWTYSHHWSQCKQPLWAVLRSLHPAD
jgi:hypothetical protein